MVTQNMLRTCEEKNDFEFLTAVYLNKCLEQIKLPTSLYTCAPSDLSTMKEHRDPNPEVKSVSGSGSASLQFITRKHVIIL